MRAANLRRALGLTVAVAALAACTPMEGNRPNTNVVYDSAIQGEIDHQLAQSSARAANALETLSMIQRARTAPVAPPLDETNLPRELKRLTTLEWSGPANELVKQLASNVGYSYLETGNPPAAPAMVHVDVHDVSAAKAFADVGLQVEQFATVIVDPNMHRVEYRNEAPATSLPPGHRQSRAMPRRHGLTK